MRRERPGESLPLRSWHHVQRAVALLTLLAASPLLALLCLAVRLDSRGPFLYRQTRPGRAGIPFSTWKIRTMVVGADRNPALARATAADAPEITRVGRMLRDLKLDELPQLWNVVRGEMALVGPRPVAPALQAMLEVEIPDFERRLEVRPGLTSLAQVCIYENEDLEHLVADWSLRFEAERHYLQHRSVAYDLVIIALTVGYLLRKVLRRLPRPTLLLRSARAAAPLALLFLVTACGSMNPETFTADGDVRVRSLPWPVDAARHGATVAVRDIEADDLPVESVEDAYRLGTGDVLRINVFNEPGLERIEVTVDGAGEIQLPVLERVAVAGMTTAELQDVLKAGYADTFVEPWVVVQIAAARSRPVYLLGEFRAAGVHYMDRAMRLLQVLAAGQGLSENAWLRGARLIREDQVAAVNVHALLRGAAMDQNVWIRSGDTLYVPALTDQRVFTLGAVNSPGAQPVANHSMTLLEAISRAGDVRRAEALTRQVRVIRSFSPVSGQLVVVDLDRILRGEAPDFPLQPGDVVFVPNNTIGHWNDVIAAIRPTLSAFGAGLDPFVTIKALED
ncbi:MAG: sugar transferase [Pseudomonadales bacterium]|jgi:polysaccharide export outer membrane protein|nr:sugar transferase [Pseudomonadales bacterium]